MALERAPTLLADFAALERRLHEPPPRRQRIRFAAECHMAYPWLVQVVARLQRTAPALELVLPAAYSEHASARLGEGKLDVAMLTSAAPKQVLFTDLFEDEMLFLVGNGHPLAARPHLTPKDLAAETLLVPTARWGDRRFVEQVCGTGKVRLNVQRFHITEAIVEFARAGLGIAVLSEWTALGYVRTNCGLNVLRLDSGPLLRNWRLAYNPTTAPVISHIHEAILASKPAARVAPGI